MCIILGYANQKGGVGKTTLAVNQGIALVRAGYKVCLLDFDPQANATLSLGYFPDENRPSIYSILEQYIEYQNDVSDSLQAPNINEAILHHPEGICLIPSCEILAGMEQSLHLQDNSVYFLSKCVEPLKAEFDFIIIDCAPSLSILTKNVLATSDYMVIPVQAHEYSMSGMSLLTNNIYRARKALNPRLSIAGVIFNMVNLQTNYNKDIVQVFKNSYGESITLFNTMIPRSVRVEELSSTRGSIFQHDPVGKVAKRIELLTFELLASINVEGADKKYNDLIAEELVDTSDTIQEMEGI